MSQEQADRVVTTVTSEEARRGVLPTEPGLYTVRPDADPAELPQYRVLRLTPGHSFIELTNDPDEERTSDAELRGMIQHYGWAMSRLVPEVTR